MCAIMDEETFREGKMKADFETIKKITVGAVRIWEEDCGVRFSRFTEEEQAGW